MDLFKSIKDLPEVKFYFYFLKIRITITLFRDDFGQVLFFTELHDYGYLILESVKLFVLHNVGALASTQKSNFVVGYLQEPFLFLQVGLLDNFYGYKLLFVFHRVEIPQFSLEYLSETTRANFADYLVLFVEVTLELEVEIGCVRKRD